MKSIGILFCCLLLSVVGMFSFGQCNTISFKEGVLKKLLTEDLFATSIDSSWMVCPQHSIGDTSLCGKISHGRDDQWTPGLPDGLLFSTFYEPRQYQLCKSIFLTPFFSEALKAIPDASAEAIRWFDWRNKSHVSIVPSMEGDPEFEKPIFDKLDWVQKKMVTVFHAVTTWTFCPEEVTDDGSIIHGICDRKNNIIIYNTACRVGKVYDADVASSALIFRIFFVCGHELGHVMDKLNGRLDFSEVDAAESRANIYGLIMTRAFAELTYKGLQVWATAIHRHSEVSAPCDSIFIARTIQKWGKMGAFFGDRIAIAQSIFKRGQSARAAIRRNKNWTIWACIERVKSMQ